MKTIVEAFNVPAILVQPKPKYRAKKTVTTRIYIEQKRTWWTRSELKQLLGRSKRKPMPEATFKTRLALVEKYCPEVERILYGRKFSDFTKWALVTIESWLRETNYNMTAVQQKLENIGLPTHEYFNSKN